MLKSLFEPSGVFSCVLVRDVNGHEARTVAVYDVEGTITFADEDRT